MGYEILKENWNLMKGRLRNWISEKDSSFYSIEQEIQIDLMKIIGKTGIRQSGSNVNEKLRELFLLGKSVKGSFIYENYSIGFPGMLSFIKSQLSRKDSNSFIWINYDSEKKEYSLIGKGSEIPKGYTNWIPKEMKIL